MSLPSNNCYPNRESYVQFLWQFLMKFFELNTGVDVKQRNIRLSFILFLQFGFTPGYGSKNSTKNCICDSSLSGIMFLLQSTRFKKKTEPIQYGKTAIIGDDKKYKKS